MKLIVKIGLIVLLLMFNYQGVDADVVFETVKNNLPPLLETIKRILSDIDNNLSS